MILPDSNEINTDFELLAPQSHENITVIPIKTDVNSKVDILTLKKGMELGLVEVKELEHSTVNTLTVKNNAVTPLLLIDGEEVLGGDQNRIVNATAIIAANSQTNISVSCTERGRWGYKSEFKSSPYIANYRTRLSKQRAIHSNQSVQDEVWSSINDLEVDCCISSPTSAMSESYENQKANLDEVLESFTIEDGQNGILIMVDGEIKGFEILLNSQIYKDFHKKIIKSYIIDAEIKESIFTVNVDEARTVMENAIDSTFEAKKTEGLEKSYEFENDTGIGTLHTFEDEIIHWSYFTKEDSTKKDEIFESIKSNPEVSDI